MKRTNTAALALTILALGVAGCGNFRERAQEVEDRIAAAEHDATIAETAAAENTGRLLELEDRIDALETEVDLLRARISSLDAPDGPGEQDEDPNGE